MNNLIEKLKAQIMESSVIMGGPAQMGDVMPMGQQMQGGELGDLMQGTAPSSTMNGSMPMQMPMQMPTEMPEIEEESSEAAEMIKSDLKTLIRNAQQMLDAISGSMEVEEWMVSKVTLATDYIVSANQYMLSDNQNGHSSSMPMSKSPMPATPKITMDMIQ
jgi:hypothetical protein